MPKWYAGFPSSTALASVSATRRYGPLPTGARSNGAFARSLAFATSRCLGEERRGADGAADNALDVAVRRCVLVARFEQVPTGGERGHAGDKQHEIHKAEVGAAAGHRRVPRVYARTLHREKTTNTTTSTI